MTQVIADVAADGLMVEFAQREPEERFCDRGHQDAPVRKTSSIFLGRKHTHTHALHHNEHKTVLIRRVWTIHSYWRIVSLEPHLTAVHEACVESFCSSGVGGFGWVRRQSTY